MKINAQCPLEIQFTFDKSLMPGLTSGERAIFTLVTCLSKNGKYSDHLSEIPYENKISVPSGKFSNTLFKILFIFDKSLIEEGLLIHMAWKFGNNFFKNLVLKVMTDFLDQLSHFFIGELTDNSVAYYE